MAVQILSATPAPFVMDADVFDARDTTRAASPLTCALHINPRASHDSLRAAADRRARSLEALLQAVAVKSTDPLIAESAMALCTMAAEVVALLDAMNKQPDGTAEDIEPLRESAGRSNASRRRATT